MKKQNKERYRKYHKRKKKKEEKRKKEAKEHDSRVTREEMEMYQGYRREQRCKRYRWFGHLACYCKGLKWEEKEIKSKNRQEVLSSKVIQVGNRERIVA